MTRRQRRRGISVPASCALLGLGLWALAGQPAHVPGALAIMTGVSAGVPLALLAGCFGLPVLIRSCVTPRRARASWRNFAKTDRWWWPGIPREQQRSSHIPAWVERAVLAADRRSCVYCGKTARPQIDHGVPWAWGGLSSLFNCFVLCRAHNLVKRDYWVDRRGRPHGHSADPDLAEKIIAAEQRARWSPARLLRAARTLGWVWLIPV